MDNHTFLPGRHGAVHGAGHGAPSTAARRSASPAPDLSRVRWRKSSYSGGSGGDCVEMGYGAPGAVPVRDSKKPSGPAIVVPRSAWSAFVTAVRDDALAPAAGA
ncbi:hypothetical protein C3486_29315 [Streptomyces sp. Ru73]|uniref:DUF397 domain-containing protein n=1 Tax=Streptomyces sp. Ru73 TaxID=2080748 RepID=UPI000CDE323B|nr:DUF397 domain-containing protein [Streptomyces sp. Ru73]POX37260.1 hypothetical protein C3486_29315 [Streptomyces sp. Ru73]